MATKHASVYPSSPGNDDSENEGQEDDSHSQDDNEEDKKPDVSNVADILKRLQSSGALIKKPKQEYRCHTCEEDFPNWEELENHIIQHVSLPSVVLDKLPSDDEAPSGDENWSDEEEDVPQTPVKTPQKIDISQILNKSGITLKKSAGNEKSSDAAISKLSGLGFTIKKGNTPVKTEPEPESNAKNVMQKLGNLGGIKLKLKSEGNNTNSFKVVNGLKDFNASDDEDEDAGKQDSNDDQDKSGEQDEGSAPESDAEEGSPKGSKTSESDDSAKGNKSFNIKSLKNLQGMSIQRKEPPKANPSPGKVIIKEMPQQKPPGRPVFKQTPKRGANPVPPKETQNQDKVPTTPERRDSESLSRDSRDSGRESHDSTVDNVVVKQEVEAVETQSSNVPIFANQIKTERSSPPPRDSFSTPVLARVKTEPEITPQAPVLQPSQSIEPISTPQNTTPLLPVAKTEDTGVTIIEINGDSNDEDDDCCVVSATPAPDVKPIVPKVESVPGYPTSTYPSSQPSYGSTNMLSSRLTAPSTEKQHSFNWNAPDSKPAIDILEKSADEIFESLLSNTTKKETHSLSDASEYISLDTLGPQHSCDVCNTKFTSISLLEDHIRMTGHAKAIDTLTPSSSSLMPYHPNPASNLLSSLLPVKQLADQVGKLSAVSQSMGGSGSGFTHQQNVMINIQAYPGSGGMVIPQQSYIAYQPGQTDFAQTANNMNNMYGGQAVPGQYPGQTYVGGQGYGQFQQAMPKPGYQSHMPGQYPPTTYSATSALQGMQQAAFGQAPTGGMSSQIGPQMGQMGPGQQMGQMGPGQQMGQGHQMGQMGPPSGSYVPSSSPGGAMKPPGSGIKIQNVQTFSPGQMLPPGQTDMSGQGAAPGQVIGGQMPPPNQIRMAPGANITGTRPRMANPRGPRPTIRPGVQVHGQVRGQKPMRMPLKRPGGNVPGPGMKRRPDMLLPGKHDNEDCHVMSMQKQRDGLPMIQSVQGAKDKLNLGSQISVTKKTVNKEANAMANVLASRGISVKQKQKSRSPTPERPIPHIPNLGAGVSIKHTSKSSNFSIPEAKVGGGMLCCKICNKMFMNHNSLAVHMSNAHPQSKVPMFKCDECPASYAKMLQLQHHRKVFHNVAGPNRELGLPVVDLTQEDNLRRLSNLGIYSFIPLANREQASGCFGIPVISVHNMQNGMTNSLQALGADGLLSLGPLKPLPNT